MNIHGLQKMTLLDYPGHVACTVFLGGCDFRCPFCHNFELADGSAKPVMTDSDLLEFLQKRVGLLDGVAFTGGEPCLHSGLPDLIRQIRKMGYGIKLDTNGYHPEMLSALLSQNLIDYVAMDIKNSPSKYAQTCGVSLLDLTPVYDSIRLLMENNVDYEFRTTVVAEFHEENDFDEMGRMIKGAKRYFLQCFTDRDSVPFDNLHAPKAEEILLYQTISSKYVSDVQIRGMDL